LVSPNSWAGAGVKFCFRVTVVPIPLGTSTPGDSNNQAKESDSNNNAPPDHQTPTSPKAVTSEVSTFTKCVKVGQPARPTDPKTTPTFDVLPQLGFLYLGVLFHGADPNISRRSLFLHRLLGLSSSALHTTQCDKSSRHSNQSCRVPSPWSDRLDKTDSAPVRVTRAGSFTRIGVLLIPKDRVL
jgi:hypothetical protein